MEAIRVLVVDDHAIVRSGCRQLLEGWGGFAVREAASGGDALCQVEENCPDLVVLDLNLPDMSGFEVLASLLRRQPPVRVLVFTMHEESGHAAKALAAGALGFITKSDDPAIIVEAARKVAAGEPYISRPMAQKLALARVSGPSDPLGRLTPRERETVTLLGRGKTIAAIAGDMGISYKTVANTLSQAKDKLGLVTTAELMRLGIATQLEREVTP